MAKMNGTFQLRVASKLLPQPFYAIFATLEQAERYGAQRMFTLGGASSVTPQPLS